MKLKRIIYTEKKNSVYKLLFIFNKNNNNNNNEKKKKLSQKNRAEKTLQVGFV